MADAGQLLAQMWGNNNFVQSYATGAQIAANLSKINQGIAADTFQQNLDVVKTAMQQSQQQFEFPLKAWDLVVHGENAETERMFANNKLDPSQQALHNSLILSQIARNGKEAAPTYQPPPGADTFNSSGLPSNGNPILPINPNANNGTASATGGPGVLPALGPLIQPPSATQGNVPIPQADRNALAQSGLQMAEQHKAQYGQEWADSLNPENDASPAELESAQGIQKFSSLLEQSPDMAHPTPMPTNMSVNDAIRMTNSNPLLNPPNGQPLPTAPAVSPSQLPAAKDAGQTAPSTPPIQQNQPKQGFYNNGDGTAYRVGQNAKGELIQTDYKWDGHIPKGTTQPIGWVASARKPEVVWSPTLQQPAEISQDGKTYIKDGFTLGKDGQPTGTRYKLKGGDGTVTVSPLTGQDGQKYDVFHYGDGRPDKIERVIPQKQATGGAWKPPTFEQTEQLNKFAKIDPNNANTARDAYKGRYGRDPITNDEWDQGKRIALQNKNQDLRAYLIDMQKSHNVPPAKFVQMVGGLPSTSAPANSGGPNDTSVPSWAQKYLGVPSNAQ